MKKGDSNIKFLVYLFLMFYKKKLKYLICIYVVVYLTAKTTSSFQPHVYNVSQQHRQIPLLQGLP